MTPGERKDYEAMIAKRLREIVAAYATEICMGGEQCRVHDEALAELDALLAPAGPPRPTPTREQIAHAIYLAECEHLRIQLWDDPRFWTQKDSLYLKAADRVLALLTPAPPQSGEKQ